MSDEEKTDLSLEGVLEHYGVKGMKWGVRKKRDKSSRKKAKKESESPKKSSGDATERFKKAAKADQKKGSLKEELAAQAANEKKSKAKIGIDVDAEPPSKSGYQGWKPTKQQVALGLVGAAYVGLVLYGAQQEGNSLASWKLKPLAPGESCSPADFMSNVMHSKNKTWGLSGYIQDSSFLQEEFTLTAGHTFHRLSTAVETSFTGPTYATADMTDFRRYVTAFRHEKVVGNGNFQHITFQAKSDIRVPSLTKRLEILKKAMAEEHGTSDIPDIAVMSRYKGLSGSSWDQPIAKKFFDALRAEGYGAIIDDMDAGVIGDRPLVVFATELLGEKSAAKMTDGTIKAAESAVTELLNRKT